MTDLSRRVALVTGGSRGIGKAVAISLAEAGAAIAVNYLEQTAAADSVVKEIRDKGGRAMAVRADVSQAVEVARMMAETEQALGPVDVLVNNAGIGLVRTVDTLTEADFDLTIAVNLKSVFLCTQAVIPGMRERKWGRIVNISSGAARVEGRDGGHDARLCGTAGEGRHHRQRRGPVADRDRHGEAGAGIERLAHPARPLRHAGGCAQIVMMLVGNAYMTGQTVALSGGMSFL